MVRRYLRQQPITVSQNPGTDYRHSFAPADEAGLGANLSAALVAQKVGVQIDGQRESLASFADFRAADCKHGGGYIGEPDHGPRLDGPEGIQRIFGNRHSADNSVFSSLFDKKLDGARASRFPDVLLNTRHSEFPFFQNKTDKIQNRLSNQQPIHLLQISLIEDFKKFSDQFFVEHYRICFRV
jgi:hypothetical protein